MSNGVGAFLGSKISSYVIGKYFVNDGVTNWHGIWLSFSSYALVIAVLFVILFRHKHDPNAIKNIHPEPVLPTD